ncbi:unnamed protein product [Lactuca saligna]|uniref:Uncharacterized protein n=1 Tax=Lactuca saligna TaxID=75948 RepID=A0AA36EIW4_LACSI|nr:unnamed protein product [Lactuca saligna]
MAKTVHTFKTDEAKTSRGRSKPRNPTLCRNREVGHYRFIEDYFAYDVIYAVKFRHRFRMRNELFLRTAIRRANRREVHNRDIHHTLRANLVEQVYMAHIQPLIEYWHDDLSEESDEDSDMFVENEDSDDESGVQENDKNNEVDDEDDDSE